MSWKPLGEAIKKQAEPAPAPQPVEVRPGLVISPQGQMSYDPDKDPEWVKDQKRRIEKNIR